ncbi:MAG: PD-(D/E)XK nuclease family protein [Nitrospira sp.]
MLYNENGTPVTTHSMIKTMRRCPRMAMYKLHDRLKPRFLGKALTTGKWMHYLLEAYYKGEDWKAVHTSLCQQFSEFFDEEKEMLGDLPTICYELMISYLWHYKNENWKVHEIEFTVQTRWPDGSIYRGKVDLLVEDDYGLWIVDHKNHRVLPKMDYRLLDTQSPLYVWAARRGDPESGIDPIPVSGFIWNYIRTAEPSKPKWLEKSGRLSKVMGDTTYPVFVREMKRLELDPHDEAYKPITTRLIRDRYRPGETQTSAFFQRHILERDDAMLSRLAAEAFRTHRRLHSYPFHQRDAVERTPDYKGCRYACSFTDLCQTELMGGFTGNLLRQNFKKGDPLSYHHDDKDLTD